MESPELKLTLFFRVIAAKALQESEAGGGAANAAMAKETEQQVRAACMYGYSCSHY